MLANRPLSRDVAATAEACFTGSLEVGAGAGEIQFLFGTPVHALAGGSAAPIEGEAAIHLLARIPNSAVTTQCSAHHPTGSTLPGWTADRLVAIIEEETPMLAPQPAGPPTTAGTPPPRPILLPAGHTMLANVALAAADLDALLERLTTGLVIITAGPSASSAVAVLGTVDGRRIDGFLHSADTLLWGDEALAACRRLGDATISAHLLDPTTVELVPELMSTPVIYENLQLEWLVWPRILSELRQRGGLTIFEIETPEGCALLALRDQDAVLDITSDHLAPGALDAITSLAESESGTLRIRHRAADDQSARITLKPVAPPVTAAAPEAPVPVTAPALVPAAPSITAAAPEAAVPVTAPALVPAAPSITAPTPKAAVPAVAAVLRPEPSPAPEEVLAPAEVALLDTPIVSAPAPAGDYPFGMDDLGIRASLFEMPVPISPIAAGTPSPELSAPAPRPGLQEVSPRVTATMLPILVDTVKTDLGPRTEVRITPTLQQAADEGWTPEALREAISDLVIPGVSKARLQRTADALATIVTEAP